LYMHNHISIFVCIIIFAHGLLACKFCVCVCVWCAILCHQSPCFFILDKERSFYVRVYHFFFSSIFFLLFFFFFFFFLIFYFFLFCMLQFNPSFIIHQSGSIRCLA